MQRREIKGHIYEREAMWSQGLSNRGLIVEGGGEARVEQRMAEYFPELMKSVRPKARKS